MMGQAWGEALSCTSSLNPPEALKWTLLQNRTSRFREVKPLVQGQVNGKPRFE